MSYNTYYIMIQTANWIMRQNIDLGLYTIGTQNAGFLKSTCFVTWTKCMDNMNMHYKLYWCLRNDSAPVLALLMYFTLCVFMCNNNHRYSCVRATHKTHSLQYSKFNTFSKHITSYTKQETHTWSTLALHIHFHISHHVKIAQDILKCSYMGNLCLIYTCTNIGKVTTVLNMHQQDLYFPCLS